MTPRCPVCFGELVVSGADVLDEGTRYGYWCPYCDAPQEPAASASGSRRLPQSYVPTTWRNVTPVDAEAKTIGLGLNLPSGEVLRVALAVDGARQLAEALTEYLADYCRTQSHSDRSEGPSMAGHGGAW